MTEFHSPPEIEEEIKRLKLQIEEAPLSEKEKLSNQLLSLVERKVEMNRRLNNMQERMHTAAEVAERAGVGTGGKGSKQD